LKAQNIILKQISGHIAIRMAAAYDRTFAALPWRIVERFYLPPTFPLSGFIDRALESLPAIGALFRFRYCLALEKPGASR
jgi:hypothetical protein